ncbi:MAG: hypothetical protein QM783_21270 [Phycisphaerales bacterium]
MKKIFTLIVLFVFANGFAQAPPEMISYRAVAMNGSTVLTTTTIGVKVSILQGSTSGTAVYAQRYTYLTDANGQYSFFIGSTATGGAISATSVLSGVFSAIDWSANTYFLKVEMDPTGGTSYTISVGTTQLATVPYAFYAKGAKTAETLDPANGGYEIVKNIYELKRNVEPVNNKLVYVKGYFEEGDGGGGFFLFKNASNFGKNLGTIFKSLYGKSCSCEDEKSESECEREGEWLRQYQGYMDVRYFGVRRVEYSWQYLTSPPYCWPRNNYQRIQNMIDYATKYSDPITGEHKSQHDLTIFFPSGDYFIEKTLILKDRVHIIGGGEVKLMNIEKPTPGYDYMFEIEGAVSHLLIENLWIDCHRSGIGGFHFKPTRKDGDKTGLVGLWDSSFRNINIYDASKPGIYLEGPDYISDGKGYKLDPGKWFQTLVFDNIRVMRWDNIYEPALKMTGYNANYTFINCEFANSQFEKEGGGFNYIDGACIFIGSNNTSEMPKQGSYAISFINSGMGVYARYGAVIQNSSSITFDTGFYEGLDIAFAIKDSKQVKIVNNRFANASGMGIYANKPANPNDPVSHLDYANGEFGGIVFAENSVVSVLNNNCDVSALSDKVGQQYFIVGIGNNNVFDVNANTFGYHELAKNSILYHIATISSEAIDTTNQKVVFVTTDLGTINDLKVIKSDLSTGEYLVIKANTGDLKFYSMDDPSNTAPGKNIFLPGGAPLTVVNGHSATFVRIEETFHLISNN